MGGRPVLLQRFPDGAAGKSFFQKRVPDGRARRGCRRPMVTTPNGTTSNALVIADIAHVVWAVNLGCLGFHVWPTHWPTTWTTPTSCASTSTRRPASPSTMIREAARGDEGVPRRARHHRASRRPPATAACTSTCAWSRDGTPTTCAPPRWPWPASSSAADADLVTAAWWKEERGAARLHRLQPERAAQDGVRRVVGAGPADGQVSTPLTWDELDHRPARRPDHRDRSRAPGRGWATRGPRWTTTRSRSSRCSSCTSTTGPPGCPDAPWPPVYPKMPDEPPRVAPSRAKRPE